MKTVHVADDGTQFATKAECVAYEKTLKTKPSESAVIVDLLMKAEADEFEAALAGKNPELGEIIEKAARMVVKARYAAGIKKRNVKKAEATEPVAAAAPPPPPPAAPEPLPAAAE